MLTSSFITRIFPDSEFDFDASLQSNESFSMKRMTSSREIEEKSLF